MSPDELCQAADELHADLCHALSDPRRIRLLYTLREGPVKVGDLARELAVPQPMVSRHLKILRSQGLVEARREGVMVYYDLTDRRVLDALDLLRLVLCDLLAERGAVARAL